MSKEENKILNEAALLPDTPVALAACDTYDEERIFSLLVRCAEAASVFPSGLAGKKVVIKPNFVMKREPDAAATVHPAVLRATIRWLSSLGAEKIIVAESPGGPYTAARLRGVYTACGATDACSGLDAALNYDVGYSEAHYPEGQRARVFDVINPILEADVVVDLCKLKTHTLTQLSGAIKNLFGVIPGIVKFEMHSRYPDYNDFSAMLNDLCAFICSTREFVAITDAIVGMEGNGPTGGSPRKIGALLMSQNPFASDAVAARLIGIEGSVIMIEDAKSRGYCYTEPKLQHVGIDGATPDALRVPDFAKPETRGNFIFKADNIIGRELYRWFRPRPLINYTACLGCGECAASCPAKTIVMMEKDKAQKREKSAKHARPQKIPVIFRDKCINCFCCQELCPHRAVKIKKNPLSRLLIG
ncbi:MAG TPA: DUF362 domain-containing protein [Bacillota bacterium]|nr:DUF362 domain-containing protein [Bacillota bacterium]